MKKGYHSTQDKAFNVIPRSEFLGIALGFAGGMITHGIVNINGSLFEIVGTAIGFVIGYLIDRKFYLEKDIPEDSAPVQQVHMEE